MGMARSLIGCFLGLVFGLGSTQASIVTTFPEWDGGSIVSYFGEPETATYGQTFRVTGSNNSLESWTFYLNDSFDTTFQDFVDFRFYIAEWDSSNEHITGGVLFSSNVISTTDNGGVGGMEAITVLTNGLMLSSNTDYIAFVSTSGLFDGIPGRAEVASVRSEAAYADGRFFFLNNGEDLGAWSNSSWTSIADFGDLVFTAEFSNPSAIPEPGTVAFCAVIAGAIVVRRRRRLR